jgi:hypothetical protein
MGRPLPVVESDDEAREQERANAQRAARRARLMAQERVMGWYARAADLLPTKAR